MKLPSAKTVSLNLTTGGSDVVDELRIITLCDGPPPVVPEVPYVALLPVSALLVGGVVMVGRRRRAALAA